MDIYDILSRFLPKKNYYTASFNKKKWLKWLLLWGLTLAVSTNIYATNWQNEGYEEKKEEDSSTMPIKKTQQLLQELYKAYRANDLFTGLVSYTRIGTELYKKQNQDHIIKLYNKQFGLSPSKNPQGVQCRFLPYINENAMEQLLALCIEVNQNQPTIFFEGGSYNEHYTLPVAQFIRYLTETEHLNFHQILLAYLEMEDTGTNLAVFYKSNHANFKQQMMVALFPTFDEDSQTYTLQEWCQKNITINFPALYKNIGKNFQGTKNLSIKALQKRLKEKYCSANNSSTKPRRYTTPCQLKSPIITLFDQKKIISISNRGSLLFTMSSENWKKKYTTLCIPKKEHAYTSEGIASEEKVLTSPDLNQDFASLLTESPPVFRLIEMIVYQTDHNNLKGYILNGDKLKVCLPSLAYYLQKNIGPYIYYQQAIKEKKNILYYLNLFAHITEKCGLLPVVFYISTDQAYQVSPLTPHTLQSLMIEEEQFTEGQKNYAQKLSIAFFTFIKEHKLLCDYIKKQQLYSCLLGMYQYYTDKVIQGGQKLANIKKWVEAYCQAGISFLDENNLIRFFADHYDNKTEQLFDELNMLYNVSDTFEEKGIIDRIDRYMAIYYRSQGVDDYDANFKNYCDDNGHDDESVTEELSSPIEDCMLLDFDDDFPFPADITLETAKQLFMFTQIKKGANKGDLFDKFEQVCILNQKNI